MFRIGGQCGLKPDEVLDMSLDVLLAYVHGCSDRLFDQQVLAVQVGFWAGYYVKSKHPKSLKNIVDSMIAKKDKRAKVSAPDVDVEAFLAAEERFKSRLNT